MRLTGRRRLVHLNNRRNAVRRGVRSASGGPSYDANTLFLANFDGGDGDTAYTEESSNARVATFVEQAQLDTAQKVFGTASLLLDGTDDYMTFPDAAYGVTGSGDFTVEFRIRWAVDPSTTTIPLMSQFQNAAGNLGWALYLVGNELGFYWSDDGTANTWIIDNAWNPAADTWYGVAVVRSGNDLFMFIDGTQLGTEEDMTTVTSGPAGIFDTPQILRLGSVNHSGVLTELNGWMDEVRISNTARYTSNYTLSTEAFTP